MYRTGDIVTVAKDGSYYFKGRRDSQIKSRGYRIELGEIETALFEPSRVREAAVSRCRTRLSAPHPRGSGVGMLPDRWACWSCNSTVRARVPKYIDSGVGRRCLTSCRRLRREKLIASSWRRSRRQSAEHVKLLS